MTPHNSLANGLGEVFNSGLNSGNIGSVQQAQLAQSCKSRLLFDQQLLSTGTGGYPMTPTVGVGPRNSVEANGIDIASELRGPWNLLPPDFDRATAYYNGVCLATAFWNTAFSNPVFMTMYQTLQETCSISQEVKELVSFASTVVLFICLCFSYGETESGIVYKSVYVGFYGLGMCSQRSSL